ncbi:MAG TPA: NADH-ubiquinone oxidoreductase-F iron-sulfur binding region domain-containing protein [Acidimicrobiales bacterium]|nr:NADH-ubiquinone oxidoreductase-F iron-sulfur binding region domain-containing protein [Acidimicrobiales bacterium]
MSVLSLLAPADGYEPRGAPPPLCFGTLGDRQVRLLAGPRAEEGPESLDAHRRRLGPLELPDDAGEVLDLVGTGGLVGRGGGEFPLLRKLTAAVEGGADPLVVVNGSEGEPASRKDRTLIEHRPHLVLDGAEVAARAVGAAEVVLYVHGTRSVSSTTLAKALEERGAASSSGPSFRLVAAPAAYVAGESSAVVSVLEGRGPVPSRRRLPVAAAGVNGRPTVVSNAESISHLALLTRFGAPWFTAAGTPETPGSTLLTLAGGVRQPGLVVEVLAPVALGEVLCVHGGVTTPPAAVLIGGYGGRWVGGAAALEAPLDRGALRRAEVPLGCGLIAPLPPDTCGLSVTLRLLGYLAAQSAGQCGPCVLGLPALVHQLSEIVGGRGTRGDIRRLVRQALSLRGRGDCAHPDGAVVLLESALHVFSEDADRHARGRSCGGSPDGGWFPIPPVLHLRKS